MLLSGCLEPVSSHQVIPPSSPVCLFLLLSRDVWRALFLVSSAGYLAMFYPAVLWWLQVRVGTVPPCCVYTCWKETLNSPHCGEARRWEGCVCRSQPLSLGPQAVAIWSSDSGTQHYNEPPCSWHRHPEQVRQLQRDIHVQFSPQLSPQLAGSNQENAETKKRNILIVILLLIPSTDR